jgi:hypothetical protein
MFGHARPAFASQEREQQEDEADGVVVEADLVHGVLEFPSRQHGALLTDSSEKRPTEPSPKGQLPWNQGPPLTTSTPGEGKCMKYTIPAFSMGESRGKAGAHGGSGSSAATAGGFASDTASAMVDDATPRGARVDAADCCPAAHGAAASADWSTRSAGRSTWPRCWAPTARPPPPCGPPAEGPLTRPGGEIGPSCSAG